MATPFQYIPSQAPSQPAQPTGATPFNYVPGAGTATEQAPQMGTLPKPLPLLTQDSGGFMGSLGIAAKDMAVGAGKELIGSARDTAGLLQTGGKMVLGGFGLDTKNAGIKSLDNSTPEGAGVADTLASKSRGEQVGKVLSGATQLVAPFAGGNVEKLIAKGKSAYEGYQAGKEAKNLVKLADATSGVADKGARISSLEQTGALDKSGKAIGGTKQTLLGGIKTDPGAHDLARAEDIKGIVKVGASPVKNLTSLNNEISRISEKEIGPALEKAGATTPISDKAPGWNTTVQRLADLEKPDIIKADATLDKTYDLVRQRMIDQIQKQNPTVKGLWDARKAFDTVVKDQFGDVAFDSEKNTAIKRAISDMRRTVNDIIGERAPQFKSQMSKLSNMYDTRYNIAEQYQNTVNKGGWRAFSTLNPKKAAALKWGTGVAGLEGLKHTIAPWIPGI